MLNFKEDCLDGLYKNNIYKYSSIRLLIKLLRKFINKFLIMALKLKF